MGEQEFGRKHVEVFGCFGFSGVHACFGPRHERDIHVSIFTFQTLGPPQIDGARMVHLVCAKATMDFSSLSNLISNQPSRTIFPLPWTC